MRIGKHLGSDMPQLETAIFGALAAGNATDPATETYIGDVPDPSLFFGPLTANELSRSSLASDRLIVRQAAVISQGAATTSAVAAHPADLRLNVWRNGLLQGCIAYLSLTANTTLGTAIVTANLSLKTAVTPASMAGIMAGMRVAIDAGGSLEYVTVLSITSTTFTAIFTKTHTTSATVVAVLVPQMAMPLVPAYAANTTSSAAVGSVGSTAITPVSIYGIRVGDWVLCDTGAPQETVQVTAITSAPATATTFTATFANTHSSGFTIVTTQPPAGQPQLAVKRIPYELREGDVLTITRVSSDTTGVATPALVARVDWVPSK